MSLTYDRRLLFARAQQLCLTNGTSIAKELGYGTQGVVFKTERNSALKIHSLESGYVRERNAYQRLKEREVRSVLGLTVPRIFAFDDRCYAIEMSLVHVPCIIDFGGAYLNNPPDHMQRDETWLEEKAEEFGKNWDAAQSVIRELEFRANLWLSDVNTGNIKFPP